MSKQIYTAFLFIIMLLLGACGSGSSDSNHTASSTSAISHDLIPSDVGLAFTKTPSISILSHTLTISDSNGLTDTAWSASSNQTWLSVTSNGTTSDTLSVTVDPTGLATDSIHYATITLTSPDNTIENSPTIQVALWYGSTDPTSISSPVNYEQVQTDPIRPFAYLNSGSDSVTVINVYTGSVVKTLNSIGTTLGAMTLSDDGKYLYAVDTSNATIAVVDLDSDSVSKTINIGSSSPQLTFARPTGHPTLVVGDSNIYDAVSGNSLGTLSDITNRALATSADGQEVCALDIGFSPWSLSCHVLAYSSIGTASVTSTKTLSANGLDIPNVGSNGQDVALNADGSKVYVASGAPYSFSVFDGTDLSYTGSLVADAYPNNVEVAPNGDLIGGIDSWYGPTDFWVYDSVGTELTTDYLSGYAKSIKARQLRISGDGKRAIALTDDPSLQIRTLP